ncbi:MAG: type I-B CRISPR-associated protein Cas5 [Acidobacteria bacterium]|nr:type I-B CRISPR-associated protein Cas5 [Acidobacteriota bacterium]
MRVLVFDIWGATAHFRRYDTTSSPLTWPFPPRPTVFGLLGAISGLDKRTYLDRFQDAGVRVAVGIASAGRAVRVPFNEPDTKKRKDGYIEGRTRIGRELLFDPRYRLFVSLPDREFFDDLASRIREHRCEYTVSLGQAWNLADFRFVDERDAVLRPLDDGGESVATVAPAAGLRAGDGRALLVRRVPRHMTSDRVVREYADVLCSEPGREEHFRVFPVEGATVEVLDCGDAGVAVPL